MFAAATIITAFMTVSAPQAADVAMSSRANPAKVTCRKAVETGSILKERIYCMTQASWNSSPRERRETDNYSYEVPLKLASPTDSQSISIGTADWAKLPALTLRGRLPYAQLVLLASDMLRNECRIAGQSARSFDLEMPYAVLVDAGGQVHQVVVSDSGCASLNTLVALTVLARAKRGDLDGSGGGTRWFADTLSLNLK